MARHSARIRRLTAQLQGRYENLRRSRLASLSYEELEAEVVTLAIRDGYPGDPAQLDVVTAQTWLDQQSRAMLAELAEPERDDLLARYPRLRGS